MTLKNARTKDLSGYTEASANANIQGNPGEMQDNGFEEDDEKAVESVRDETEKAGIGGKVVYRKK